MRSHLRQYGTAFHIDTRKFDAELPFDKFVTDSTRRQVDGQHFNVSISQEPFIDPDMSENGGVFLRSAATFISQKNLMVGVPPEPRYLASACTPYLSPAGMLMPVANAWGSTPFDARHRFPNTYSFIQSLAEHSYDGGGDSSNYPASRLGLPAGLPTIRHFAYFGTDNVEESRVVTNSSVYTRTIDNNGSRLLLPVDMHEIVRGRKISFHLPFDIGGCTKQGPLKWYCTKWIWKRTYNLMDKWELKQSADYAYEFVGRRP